MAALLLLGSLGAASASALVTTYASRSAWNAAVGPRTTIDFEGLEAPGSYRTIAVPNGLTLQGVNFSTAVPTNGDDFILAGPVAYGPSSVLGMYDSATGTRTLVISLPGAAASAIGLDMRTTGDPRTVDVELSTGERFGIFVNGTPRFLGIVSMTPIARVSLTEPPGTNVLLLDDVSFALATAEASTPVQGVPTLTDSMLLLLAAAIALAARYGRTKAS